MIFVENELHHVNEADTVTKGKSANAKDNAKGKSVNAKGDAIGRYKRQDTQETRYAKGNAMRHDTRFDRVKSLKAKSQPKTRKRQIEDLVNDDAALVLVDEEEEGLLIQKI